MCDISAPFRAVLPEEIFTVSSWEKCTSLGAGLSPVTLLEPRDEAQLFQCVSLARKYNLKIFTIGGGFNIAGTDTLPENMIFLRLPGGGVFARLEILERNDEFCLIRCGGANSLRSLLTFALKEEH